MSIFIDGHVHIHPQFSLDHFFAAAFDNFSKAAAKSSVPGNPLNFLALTEGRGSDVFSQLYQNDISLNDSFELQKTEEKVSLLVRRGEQTIILIAGRQLVSRENIELLSLFSSVNVEDKSLSLFDLAQTVTANNGLAVVPWGVGKWFGARGKVVAELLNSNHPFPLFYGDNGNRPLLWPEPNLLSRVKGIGNSLLSGSDPLPLVSHCLRPASFGSLLRHHGELSLEFPAASLKQLLTPSDPGTLQLESFGQRIGSLQFLRDQLRINLRNRLPVSSSSGR